MRHRPSDCKTEPGPQSSFLTSSSHKHIKSFSCHICVTLTNKQLWRYALPSYVILSFNHPGPLQYPWMTPQYLHECCGQNLIKNQLCSSMYCLFVCVSWSAFSKFGHGSLSCLQIYVTTPLGKSSRTFFHTSQIFKLIFWDCYKNVAFCNMNCNKQFINFSNFGVNPFRFSGR